MIIKCVVCGKNRSIASNRVKKNNYCSLKCYGIWLSKNRYGEKSPSWKGGEIEKTCQLCGKAFKVKPYRSAIAKHCSTKCHNAWLGKNQIGCNSPVWKGGKIERVCGVCGKQFLVSQYRIKIGIGKFCSRKCSYLGKYSKVQKTCPICGNNFTTHPSKIKDGGGKFCSLKCVAAANIKYRSGRNSPQWRGGRIKCTCKLCGKEFYRSKSTIGRGHVKFCSHHCRAIVGILNGKNKDTSIEIKMESELTRRGIVFKKQHPIWQARTVPDFFIEPNICIYCDGDYWHNLPDIKSKDERQNFSLNFLGYKIYRFWEHEINSSIKKCVDSIKEAK